MVCPQPVPPSRARARTFSALVLTLAASLLAALAPAPAAAAKKNHPSHDAREKNVIKRINAVRADHGLRPLKLQRGISRTADHHSKRQHRAGTLTHQLPGQFSPQRRLAKFGGRSGEVVFWASNGARSSTIVRNWMRSPGHRAVLLSPQFRRVGVGIRTGRGGLYATVDVVTR